MQPASLVRTRRSCRTITCASLTAFEALALLRIAFALVMSVFRVRTQRAAPSGERTARRRHGIRRHALFYPADDRIEQVESIERRLTAAAMPHAGNEKQPAPASHRGGTAVVFHHFIVVPNR